LRKSSLIGTPEGTPLTSAKH